MKVIRAAAITGSVTCWKLLIGGAAALTAACAPLPLPAVYEAPAAAEQPTASSALVGSWEGEMEDDPFQQFITLTIAPPGTDPPGTFGILFRTLKLRTVTLNGNAVRATIGTGESAVTIHGELENDRLAGTLTQRDRVQPFRLRRIPEYAKPSNRIAAWEQDIDVLSTRFLEADRSFSTGEQAMFLEALDLLRKDLPTLNDAQVTVRMAAAIALAGNAHTRLYLLRNATQLRRLPVRLWWFSDGLYVVRATKAHADLLGCRIDSIADASARRARDRVGPLFAGNPSWRDYKSVYSLTSPETLHGVGIIPHLDSVEVGVSGCPGPPRRTIRPLPLARSQRTVEAWWDLSPVFRAPGEEWRHVLEDRSERLPLYLRSDDNFHFDYVPESSLIYFQYNRADHMPDETTAAFGERLLAEIERRRPRAFVLDLRFNTGGNLSLAEELMETLKERTRGMQRYVITGPATFSAGISQAVVWREEPDVLFVGEPAGDALDHWGEGGVIELPNSRYEANFANGLHSYSLAPCPPEVPCREKSVASLGPDIPTWLSWADYRAMRDPAMKAILSRLRRSR